MKTSFKSSLTLPEVADHFQQWRNIKQPWERIPDQLWYEAISLLGAYRVTQVTRTLRLSSTDFNKRRRLIEAGQHQPDAAGKTALPEYHYLRCLPALPDLPLHSAAVLSVRMSLVGSTFSSASMTAVQSKT